MQEEKKKIRGNPANLQPVRSKEEASERGRVGGIRSGEARREKKMLSQIYADYLAKQHGAETISEVITSVLARGDSSSVSMLKEMREATEGSKVEHSGNITNSAPLTVEEAKRKLKEIEDDL